MSTVFAPPGHLTDAPAFPHELGIVWLEDPDAFDYVRVYERQFQRRRQAKPSYGGEGRLVGYTELEKDAPRLRSGGFERRLFWLNAHDRDSGDPCYRYGTPSEGVDPRTLETGRPGHNTVLSWMGRDLVLGRGMGFPCRSLDGRDGFRFDPERCIVRTGDGWDLVDAEAPAPPGFLRSFLSDVSRDRDVFTALNDLYRAERGWPKL